MIRENVTLIGSQRLIEMLCRINHSIAHQLLEQMQYHGRTTISYLDFGEANDSISFIYSNKMFELQREFDYKWTDKVWKEKRSDMKIGKVIRLIFGEHFPVNNPKGQPMPKPPVDIETFVNMYKAEREKNENTERFHIVNGQDIVFWYNFKNYTRFVREDTPLGKSCLRYEESGKFLEMYVKNPDKVSMLILKDDQDKLRGRSILWNLDFPENRMYLDRIYTVNDFDVELFKDYARKNGWLHKERQTFGWNNVIVDTRDNSLHTPNDLKLEVKLTNKKIKFYPYVDTLSVYNKKTGILNNQGQLLRREGHIHLIDYQGSYVDEVDHREYVYSNYYNDDILREEAVYCQIDDDWVYRDDAVYVHNTDGLYAVKGSTKIVHCKFLNKSKYFIKEDAVYSDYMETWIYKDSVREAFADSEKTKKVIIHFRLIGKTFHREENGDIVIGEPKKVETPVKKKYPKKKKLQDVEDFYSVFMNEPPDPRPIPDYVIREMERLRDREREELEERQLLERENSTEEEGDGSNYPIPRGRRRQTRLRSLNDNMFRIARDTPRPISPDDIIEDVSRPVDVPPTINLRVERSRYRGVEQIQQEQQQGDQPRLNTEPIDRDVIQDQSLDQVVIQGQPVNGQVDLWTAVQGSTNNTDDLWRGVMGGSGTSYHGGYTIHWGNSSAIVNFGIDDVFTPSNTPDQSENNDTPLNENIGNTPSDEDTSDR